MPLTYLGTHRNIFPSSAGSPGSTAATGEGGTWALFKKKRAEKVAQRPPCLPPPSASIDGSTSPHSPTPERSPRFDQPDGPRQTPSHNDGPTRTGDDSFESEDDDIAQPRSKIARTSSVRVQSEEEGEEEAQPSRASGSVAAPKKQAPRRGGTKAAKGAQEGSRATRSRTGNHDS